MSFFLPAPFSSPRLTIRLVQEGDLPALMEINGDDEVTRFLPYPSWAMPADGQAWLGRMQVLTEQGATLQFVIVERSSGRVIGSCLLFRLDEGSARAEIGYVMGRAWWRQGLCTEAVSLLVAHAFDAAPDGQGVRRLEAQVNPDNAASNRLLVRLGFRHEGCLRQRWVSNGAAIDTNFYGLLRHEWPQPDSLQGSVRQS